MTVLHDFWNTQPPVTRVVTTTIVGAWLLTIVHRPLALLFWNLPGKAARLQLWRPVTALAFLPSAPAPSDAVFFFVLHQNLRRLETRMFRTAELVWYLALVSLFFMAVGPYLRLYAYLPGLAGALAYTVSQDAPYELVDFMMVFKVWHAVVPWLSIIIAYAWMGDYYTGVAGILVAHAYLFLSDIVPAAGGRNWLAMPVVVSRLLEPRLDPTDAKARVPGQRFGSRGQRLGS